MKKAKKYYFVPYSWDGQHGCDVWEITVTDEERAGGFAYTREKRKIYGAFFTSYASAMYYILD